MKMQKKDWKELLKRQKIKAHLASFLNKKL